MKQLLLLFMALACSTQLWAQRQISGQVTNSDDGSGISNVSVIVTGTTQGVLTDAQGSFRLSVPATASTLTLSYVGFKSQEVAIGSKTVFNISMEEADVQLDEVVVTAFGIERDKKGLQYSVTEVDGTSFTEAREMNVANALAGKVAGVNVSNIASGPAGSSRVVIRGNVSLNGNNQPLYVIDGIPMDNSGFGQAGMWGGSDEGDGTSSINPDDIETMTVLKGANAAALYGSRASNGVILITTKSGVNKKGIGVELNSNFVFDQIYDLTDYQTTYGQGNQGMAPVDQTEAFTFGESSWGGKLDGSMVPQFDGVARPYSYTGSNIDRYFRTGTTFTNSIGLSGGTEDQNFRLSASNLNNTAVSPNAGYDRRNLSLSYNGKFGKRISITSKVMYSNENAKNRPRVSDSPGNGAQSVMRAPANYNVEDQMGDPEKLGAVPAGFTPVDLKATGEELQTSTNLWGQNPYWAAYQYENSDVRDRIINSNVARIEITDFLYAQGRIGMDWYTRRERDVTPYGTGYQRNGSIREREDRVREINIEGLIGFDEDFGDFNVNAIVGGNRMRRSFERFDLNGSAFNIPFFHQISNAANQSIGYGFNEKGINSVFGSAQIGYKGYLFLSATARNDWFSTLNPETNSILYPSVGGSFVFSDAFNISGKGFTFGKVRASWAQVGGDTDPYQTLLTYSLGQGHLGIPTAFTSQSSIPNPDLKPLTSAEFEIGVDLRFLDNRLGFDLTYYQQKTTDDILNATISPSSGFGGTTINIGEMQNRGLEALITATPVQTKDFSWDVSFNFSLNDNEVIGLTEGLDRIQIGEPRTRQAFIQNIVGNPFSTIVGFTQQTINGVPVFDASNGQPILTDTVSVLGQGVHRFVGGLNNRINFKGFYLDFLLDFKTGGDIYSGSNVRLTQWGLHKQTVENTSGPGFVANGRESIQVTGVDPTGEALSLTVPVDEVQGFWGAYGNLSDRFIYDASFIKLRQVSFGYTLPASLLKNSPLQSVNLSFVGRNLLLIYSNMENVDPESNYANVNAQGFDYFGVPQNRSYGVNLRIKF